MLLSKPCGSQSLFLDISYSGYIWHFRWPFTVWDIESWLYKALVTQIWHCCNYQTSRSGEALQISVTTQIYLFWYCVTAGSHLLSNAFTEVRRKLQRIVKSATHTCIDRNYLMIYAIPSYSYISLPSVIQHSISARSEKVQNTEPL